jgi:hypothetical protein
MDPFYHPKKRMMAIGKKKKQDMEYTTHLSPTYKYPKDYLDYKLASEQN